jgi:molecular chaperone DnaJ
LARDFYSVLGVSRTATDREIKHAFRKLAKQFHPDVNRNDPKASERFKEVSEAYETLSDKDKRAKYDMVSRLGGHDDAGGSPFSGFPGGFPGSSGRRQGASSGARSARTPPFQAEVPPGFEGFADLFGDLFNEQKKSTRRKSSPTKGQDVETSVTLSLRDAIMGSRSLVELRGTRACPDCNGTGSAMGRPPGLCPDCGGTGKRAAKGFVPYSRNCDRCHGTGKAILLPCTACDGKGSREVAEKLKVTIPAGVEDGNRIRVRGKGVASDSGGAPGDLFLVVKVTPDPVFRREGKDLHADVRVHALDAMLGATVEVETLDGKATMKIPAGTQGGQKFRLKGKGVPGAKEGELPGDLYVAAQIDIPRDLDDDARALVRQLRRKVGLG